MSEALIGQLYAAVLIATLVAMSLGDLEQAWGPSLHRQGHKVKLLSPYIIGL